MGGKNGVRQFFRLLRLYGRMDLLWFLRDTKICLMYMISDLVIAFSSIAAMLLLAGRLGPATGLAPRELLFMLGCPLITNGLFSLTLSSNNAGAISRIIGRGQLDHALIQPVPLPLIFATQGFAPVSGSLPLLAALGYTVWAAAGLEGGVLLLAKLLPLCLLGFCILIAWVFGISCLAFWAPYAAEEIAPDVSELFTSLGPYPLGALSGGAQLLLTTILPVGTMGWLPASIVLDKAPFWGGTGLLCAVAAASLTATTLLFRKGLNHYAKYFCPRYSGFGRT